jgi:hypothetical protein
MPTNIETIQAILSQQEHVGRPSPAICSAVAGLKDLCELNGGAIDWRRNISPAQGRGSRAVFKSGSSNSLANGINRSNSSRSFNSASSPPTSPVGGGSPYSPIPSSGGYSPPARYHSKLKNTSQPVEDKILNNIILSKLNKFSLSTYNDVRDFLYQILGSGEPDLGEMVRQFMIMVFKKAASEEIYCSLYAKLLAEISTRYTVILEEMHTLQKNYLEIFDEVEEVPEGGDNYDVFVEKNKDKRYRQGYSQFLAELAALEILELTNLEVTVKKLIELLLKCIALPDKKTLVEEYADCLIRMSRVLKKKSSPFFATARTSLLNITKSSIDTIISQKDSFPSLSSKARFILMDFKDNLTK